jgi:hypothetical protein
MPCACCIERTSTYTFSCIERTSTRYIVALNELSQTITCVTNYHVHNELSRVSNALALAVLLYRTNYQELSRVSKSLALTLVSIAADEEGDLKGWSTVLVTALGSNLGKPVPCGHAVEKQTLKDGLQC